MQSRITQDGGYSFSYILASISPSVWLLSSLLLHGPARTADLTGMLCNMASSSSFVMAFVKGSPHKSMSTFRSVGLPLGKICNFLFHVFGSSNIFKNRARSTRKQRKRDSPNKSLVGSVKMVSSCSAPAQAIIVSDNVLSQQRNV